MLCGATQFLGEIGVMDYSLLVGVHDSLFATTSIVRRNPEELSVEQKVAHMTRGMTCAGCLWLHDLTRTTCSDCGAVLLWCWLLHRLVCPVLPNGGWRTGSSRKYPHAATVVGCDFGSFEIVCHRSIPWLPCLIVISTSKGPASTLSVSVALLVCDLAFAVLGRANMLVSAYCAVM